VIDDEIDLASLYKEFLKKEGYNVVSFTDPELAFEYCAETADKISLILTNLRMPGMSGLQLAKNIREINSKVKIFLMTAFDTADLRADEDFKKAKTDRLLQKPIRFADLRQMINESLKVLNIE
jgi:DNA-binding NtrC family response regulator